VAGAILSRGHNISRFTLFVVAGGTLGALNYIGGKWLYNFSRQTWLTSRRTMVENKRLFEATNPAGLITQQPKSTSNTFSK
jgi:membrane protein YqaA with SNARE-associated domain